MMMTAMTMMLVMMMMMAYDDDVDDGVRTRVRIVQDHVIRNNVFRNYNYLFSIIFKYFTTI